MNPRFHFWLKMVLPVIYIPLFIILPLCIWNPDYGWSVVIGFWIPILLLAITVLPKEEVTMRKAFFISTIGMIPITIAFEFVGLALDIWNFSEAKSRLWGLNIMGAPIEEFIFWFGATPLCQLLYLYYRHLFPGTNNEPATTT